MTTKKRPSSNGSGASPTDGDAFLLNENGTVRVRWRGHNVLLWTPLVGEFETIIVEYQDTRAWYSEEGRTASEAFSPKAPNALIWVKIIELLGDSDPVEPEDLAPWMLTADSIEKLIVHWRVNPLARGESEDLIARLATEMVSQVQAGTTRPSTSPEVPSEESEAT